jgi:hypothetical protein
VVLQDAAVHDHDQAGGLGAPGGLFVNDALLHPNDARPLADGGFDDFRHELGAPVDIDDVDRWDGVESG